MARRAGHSRWSDGTGDALFYPGGETAPPGTYEDVDTGRRVLMLRGGPLPPSHDGRVACYRRLGVPEGEAALPDAAPLPGPASPSGACQDSDKATILPEGKANGGPATRPRR